MEMKVQDRQGGGGRFEVRMRRRHGGSTEGCTLRTALSASLTLLQITQGCTWLVSQVDVNIVKAPFAIGKRAGGAWRHAQIH